MFDESRFLRVSHTEKSATLKKAIPLSNELQVESALQGHGANRLIEALPPTTSLSAKKESTGTRRPYEAIRDQHGEETRNVVWAAPRDRAAGAVCLLCWP